jgi:hypothetical protein
MYIKLFIARMNQSSIDVKSRQWTSIYLSIVFNNSCNFQTWFINNRAIFSINVFLFLTTHDILLLLLIHTHYDIVLKRFMRKILHILQKEKILKKKKNSFIWIQSSSRFLNDVTSFKNRMNDVFDLFIYCFFQYQELKIVCVTNQTSEMSNF